MGKERFTGIKQRLKSSQTGLGGRGEILLSLDLKTVVQTRPLDSRNDIPLPDRTYTPQFGQTVASVLPEMTMSPMRQPKAALDKSP